MIVSVGTFAKRRTTDSAPTATGVARTFYISNSGSGDGLSSGAPMSPTTLIGTSINHGDTFSFNKGETIELATWTITGKNNITITSYGTGAMPILTGSTSLSAATWTDQGSGQYSTPLASCKWIYLSQLPAKNAESAWIPITLNVSAQVRRVLAATVNAFTDTIVGAKIIVREWLFRMGEELTVSAYASGTGNITFTGTLAGGEANMPLKVINMRQFISANGDWAYNGTLLYIKSAATPAGTDIRISANDKAISATGCNNLNINNLSFRHYFKTDISITNCDNFTCTACTGIYGRGDFLRVGGDKNDNPTITYNTVTYKGLRAIQLGGCNYGTIAYNTITDIGEDANVGRPYDYDKNAGGICQMIFDPYFVLTAARVNNNNTFHHNTIRRVAYNGLFTWGNDNIIEKNFITDYCSRLTDGGGIYMSYGNYLGMYSSTQRNIIRYNIIKEGIGNLDGIAGSPLDNTNGIYMDNGSFNNTVTNNVIIDPGLTSIIVNFFSSQQTVTNNICVGGDRWNIWFRDDNSGVGQPYFDYLTNQSNVLTGNISVVKATAGRTLSLWNNNNNATFNPFTTINNNHYVQPYNTSTHSRIQNGGVTDTDLTFSAWKTYIGSDGASTSRSNYKVTPDADDVLVEYNATDSSVEFNIPGGYTDVYGNAPSNPYTIPAWGGLVYLQS